MSSPRRRIETDVMKMMSDYEVTLVNDNSRKHYKLCATINYTEERIRQEFYVKFPGPKETPYEGGVWKIHVELPEQYPYRSPSIGFINRIYHPNIDEMSGSVCLDVINQTWSPMFEMVNIFESFLPQLLRYPNSADPLNGDAAALHARDINSYNIKVKDYVTRWATAEAAEEAGADEEDDEDMSSAGSFDSDKEDEEPAGQMEEV